MVLLDGTARAEEPCRQDWARHSRPTQISPYMKGSPMNQKRLLVITLTLVVFAVANSALAQDSTPAKKDTAKTSAPNDPSQASPDDFVKLLREDIRPKRN
jgi:hypothetical protein